MILLKSYICGDVACTGIYGRAGFHTCRISTKSAMESRPTYVAMSLALAYVVGQVSIPAEFQQSQPYFCRRTARMEMRPKR
jgi:hypothetical protein